LLIFGLFAKGEVRLNLDDPSAEADVAGYPAAVVEPAGLIAGRYYLRNGLVERVSKQRRSYRVLWLRERHSRERGESLTSC
jgi:hypothetical protein